VARRKAEHARFRREEPELFIGDVTKLGEVIASSPCSAAPSSPSPGAAGAWRDLYARSPPQARPKAWSSCCGPRRTSTSSSRGHPGDHRDLVGLDSPFHIAAAVITDVGGILSHSPILGREYGLPVISGCVEGTRKLKTGMRVRVDGDAGAVYILDGPEA